MSSANENDRRKRLWEKYAQSKDQNIRDEIITEYSYLIKYVAGRLSIYFGSNVEYEDLVSYGVFGLLDAIDKFDPKKGVKFETYASLRIRGAILDSIRSMDWAPRSLRQKQKELEQAYLEIESEKGKIATDEEVAKKLGISLKEYYKLLNEVNTTNMVSLEEFLEQNYEINTSANSQQLENQPDMRVEFNELRELLAESIDKLPEKERTVITLYYYEDLTLKEISKIMNVSESRISQLHTKALLRLRGRLSVYNSANS